MSTPTPEEMLAAAKAASTAGDEWTEWEVAFHEAGHVVVEVASGSYPDEVYLNDGGLAGGNHAGRTVSRSWSDIDCLPTEGLNEEVASFFDAYRCRYAGVLAAGGLALHIARGSTINLDDMVLGVVDPCEPGTDEQELLALVDGRMSLDEAEPWLRAAFAEAERLLREWWADVEKVAAALVTRRHLDRTDLWNLLDVERFPRYCSPPAR